MSFYTECLNFTHMATSYGVVPWWRCLMWQLISMKAYVKVPPSRSTVSVGKPHKPYCCRTSTVQVSHLRFTYSCLLIPENIEKMFRWRHDNCLRRHILNDKKWVDFRTALTSPTVFRWKGSRAPPAVHEVNYTIQKQCFDVNCIAFKSECNFKTHYKI